MNKEFKLWWLGFLLVLAGEIPRNWAFNVADTIPAIFAPEHQDGTKYFGHSVAMTKDAIFVGAPGCTNDGSDNPNRCGAATDKGNIFKCSFSKNDWDEAQIEGCDRLKGMNN